MNSGNSYLLLGLFMGIGIFLLLREFWTWYFKINKIVSVLEDISRKLDKLDKLDEIIETIEVIGDIETSEDTENNKYFENQ